MPKTMLAIALCLAVLAACAGRYTGDESYYTEKGVAWSCREPAPFKGGNCRIESSWPDGGVDG